MQNIDDYVAVLTNASGITTQQAKTCLYYAISTHLEHLSIMPILAIIGAQGTGKSALLEQLRCMVSAPKLIGAESPATLRDALADATTALIDEGDKADERYLQRRYSIKTAEVTHNVAKRNKTWHKSNANIFGATIIVRRTPFEDPATRSRAIVIHTKYRKGKYVVQEVDSKHLADIANSVKLENETSQRINDNWRPLQAVARTIGDDEWLSYSQDEIKKDVHAMMASQGFEPEEAVLVALREKMITIESNGQEIYHADPLVSDLKGVLKQHYDLNLKSYQIKELCIGMGFKVVTTDNYPKVKANAELIEKLLKERGLTKEN
jgi:hypothetical protein